MDYARTDFTENQQPFSLKANEISKRQRNGRIIKFVDYDEIYFKAVSIEQPLNTPLIKLDMRKITALAIPFSENRQSEPDPNNPAQSKSPILLGNQLNRLLADGFSINFKPQNKPPIRISADSAGLLTETLVIRFAGNVVVKAAKCHISADFALWSNTYNGLYLPQGYRFNRKTFEKPAFFQITDTGKCQKTAAVQSVEYVDRLDQIEDTLFESMPPEVRMMYGFMGAPDSRNGFGELIANPD